MESIMPSKSAVFTILWTVGVLWAIHNLDALKPAKKFMNFGGLI
jgi:hypothetical protein